jgi:N-acetylmuramoyl-L-alanine amidase
MERMRTLVAIGLSLFLAHGSHRTLLYRSPTDAVGPPVHARFSPDHRWVLFQTDGYESASIAADGLPLLAVPVTGGRVIRVESHVLPWPDFVQRCGDGFVVSAGFDRYVSARKHVDLIRPPRWRPVDISRDARWSWYAAACSPDEKWVAATRTVNGDERRIDAAERSIWLLATDGSSRRRLVGRASDGISDESPRWSADGRFVTYDEHAARYGARAQVYRIDVATGRRIGPLTTVAPADDYYGHQTWRALPLLGKTIAVDPGHNGANWAHRSEIDRLVDAGGFRKACDTTGTSTNDGISEAWYDFDVAVRLTHILRSQGARVVLTRTSNDGVGPCIDERAAIGNRAHADAAISIHADGGPPGGRGFEVIYTPNAPASRRLALAVRRAFAAITDEPYSTYVGRDGLDVRTDLGGLNLSTVPKVLIETANMRNATDARRIESAAYRQREAVALARGIESFLS